MVRPAWAAYSKLLEQERQEAFMNLGYHVRSQCADCYQSFEKIEYTVVPARPSTCMITACLNLARITYMQGMNSV